MSSWRAFGRLACRCAEIRSCNRSRWPRTSVNLQSSRISSLSSLLLMTPTAQVLPLRKCDAAERAIVPSMSASIRREMLATLTGALSTDTEIRHPVVMSTTASATDPTVPVATRPLVMTLSLVTTADVSATPPQGIISITLVMAVPVAAVMGIHSTVARPLSPAATLTRTILSGTRGSEQLTSRRVCNRLHS